MNLVSQLLKNKHTKSKTKTKTILTISIFMTVLFIWGNSILPGTVSSEISNQVLGFIKNMLDIVPMPQEENSSFINIRKLAHFLEFMLLGLELSYFFLAKTRLHLSTVLLCGFMTALIDETIQMFSAGRGPMVGDIWIDIAGFGFGFIVVVCIEKFWNAFKRYKNKVKIKSRKNRQSLNSR